MPSECSEAVLAPLRLSSGYGLSHNPREDDCELAAASRPAMNGRLRGWCIATPTRCWQPQVDCLEASTTLKMPCKRHSSLFSGPSPGLMLKRDYQLGCIRLAVNAALAQLRSRHRRVPELLLEHLRTECDALA